MSCEMRKMTNLSCRTKRMTESEMRRREKKENGAGEWSADFLRGWQRGKKERSESKPSPATLFFRFTFYLK